MQLFHSILPENRKETPTKINVKNSPHEEFYGSTYNPEVLKHRIKDCRFQLDRPPCWSRDSQPIARRVTCSAPGAGSDGATAIGGLVAEVFAAEHVRNVRALCRCVSQLPRDRARAISSLPFLSPSVSLSVLCACATRSEKFVYKIGK